jgi:peptide deformylase
LIVTNKEEEKFLRKRPADFDFSKYTEHDLRELIAAMRSIMRKANGVGLSANQVGLDMQLFIAEIPQRNKAPKLYAIFNPKIIRASKELRTMEEGCLSVPKLSGLTTRSKEVTLTGFDKHKKPVKIKAAGLLAQVFQHETDHLNGALFIDKATNIHEVLPEQDTTPDRI